MHAGIVLGLQTIVLVLVFENWVSYPTTILRSIVYTYTVLELQRGRLFCQVRSSGPKNSNNTADRDKQPK